MKKAAPVLLVLSLLSPMVTAEAGEATGAISGRVTDPTTGLPIERFRIRVRSADGAPRGFALTDEAGRYTVSSLAPGVYLAVASDFDFEYLAELYDGVPCPGAAETSCDLSLGERIPIDANDHVTGVDFTPRLGGSISGTARDAATGAPARFVEVSAYDATGELESFGRVEEDGRYRIPGLPTGSFFLRTEDPVSARYVDEVYDDRPCLEDCDPTAGDAVAVIEGIDTPGIDFELDRFAGIAGRVREATTGAPVVRADVTAWNAAGEAVATARTDVRGRYRLQSLLAGRHFVTVDTGGRYLDELYDDLPCAGGGEPGCVPTDGRPVELAFGDAVSGIDFELDLETGLRGRVTARGRPLAGVQVIVYPPGINNSAGVTTTGIDGRYAIGLLPGTYVALTSNGYGARDEVWDDLACSDFACDRDAGTPIVLDAVRPIAGGIDFDLELGAGPCRFDRYSLCLNDGRFRVEVEWATPEGDTGVGQSFLVTDDSGTFWFFDPANLELIVKVHDACVAPYDRFWVFAAGLTDVEVTMIVTDTLTAERRIYRNPLGTPLAPIQDTAAFATCPAGARPAELDTRRVDASPPIPKTVGRHPPYQSLPRTASPAHLPRAEAAGIEKGICQPSPVRLCLQDGRFAVETGWTIPTGDAGRGNAVSLSADTGYFTFFGRDNIEVMVKVLDACELPGFNAFWVFAAGLTNVGVDLTVIDTETGETQVYRNPLGTPFQPLQDVAAFLTCP